MLANQSSILRRYTPPTCTLNIWAKPSPLSLWTNRTILEALNFELHFDDPRLLDHEQVSIRGTHQQLEILCDLVTHYVQNFLQQTDLPESSLVHPSNTATLTKLQTTPSIKQKGLLFHELDLGNFRPNGDNSTLELSSSQLCDLADALESYRADLQVIPSLYRSCTRKTLFIWGSAVATILLAIGIPTLFLPWYQAQSGKNNNVASESPQQPTPETAFLDVTPPVPPPPKGAIPNPNTPPVLATREQLPAPPPSQTLPTPPRPQTTPLVVPPEAVVPPPPVVPPAPPRQILQIEPQEPLGANQVTVLPAPQPATITPDLSTSSGVSLTPELNLPQLPPLDRADRTSLENARSSAPMADNLPISPPPASVATQTGLLDPIPQVVEVRNHFEQTWKPPAELQQTIEYRLLIAENGSIAHVKPLGKAATLYQPQTGMPNIGQPFVSPLSVEGQQTIRLVLTPKGKVKTFLEDREN